MPKAIRIYETGGPEVMRLEDVDVGKPGEGQARVRHTAVGVNYIGTYHRSGLYPLAEAHRFTVIWKAARPSARS